jgi:hypothetical protein
MRKLLTGALASVLTLGGLSLPTSTARADDHHGRDWHHYRDGHNRRYDRDDWRHRGWWGYPGPYRAYYAPYYPAPYCAAPYPDCYYPSYGFAYKGPYFGVWVGH